MKDALAAVKTMRKGKEAAIKQRRHETEKSAKSAALEAQSLLEAGEERERTERERLQQIGRGNANARMQVRANRIALQYFMLHSATL